MQALPVDYCNAVHRVHELYESPRTIRLVRPTLCGFRTRLRADASALRSITPRRIVYGGGRTRLHTAAAAFRPHWRTHTPALCSKCLVHGGRGRGFLDAPARQSLPQPYNKALRTTSMMCSNKDGVLYFTYAAQASRIPASTWVRPCRLAPANALGKQGDHCVVITGDGVGITEELP